MDRSLESRRRRGNDPAAGLRLDRLLTAAGLEVASFLDACDIFPAPPRMRPPACAARDVMLADGTVDWDNMRRPAAALSSGEPSQ